VKRQLWLLGQGARVDAALRAAAPPEVRGRMVFADKVAVRDHVRRLRQCHVALDTAAIGAHTTAANYLWARVPVVTLPGQHVVSRVGASLLVALSRASHGGCPAVTLVRSEEEYVAVARALAKAAGDKIAAQAPKARSESPASPSHGTDAASPDVPGRGSAGAAYARVRECLRAATEPLDALSPGSSRYVRDGRGPVRVEGRWPARMSQEGGGGGGGGGEGGGGGGGGGSAWPGPGAEVVFDNGRWVRDWERALSLAVEVLLSGCADSAEAASARGGVGFSLVVSG